MRKSNLLLGLSLLVSAPSFTQDVAYDVNNIDMECEYEYERNAAMDDPEKTIEFKLDKQINADGTVTFSKEINNITSYSTSVIGEYTAQWHRDAKITVEATLKGSTLDYAYKVYNYYTDMESLVVQKEEERSITFESEEIDPTEEDYADFDIDDGKLIYVNGAKQYQGKYLSGPVQLEECKLIVDSKMDLRTI